MPYPPNRRGMKVAREKRRLRWVAVNGPVCTPEDECLPPVEKSHLSKQNQDVEKLTISQD